MDDLIRKQFGKKINGLQAQGTKSPGGAQRRFCSFRRVASFRRIALSGYLSAGSFMVASWSHAQELSAGKSSQEQAASSTSQDQPKPLVFRHSLEEIVVTVDRHRKNLQDYAGTVSAFSETQLTALGVGSVQELAQMVPGLQIGINNGGATIYLRGLGSDNTTELGDTGVAVHADGVYLPRFRGMGATFLDVERVEVSSGPQGTIRGHNTLGGAINVISRKPIFGEYQGMAEATFGTFRQRAYQGMVNIPFGNSAALRVAASSTNIDALWSNSGPIDDLPGAQSTNDYAMKAAFRWAPMGQFELTLAADYGLQRGTGWGSVNVIGLLRNRDNAGTEFDLSDDFYASIDPNSLGNPRQIYRKGRSPSTALENWGLRLSMNYDLGPVEVEFLASQRYQNWQLFGGSALGPFADTSDISTQQWDDWSFAPQRQHTSSSTVGELRFSSPTDQRFTGSLGLLGFYEDQAMALGQVTGDRSGGFNEFNMPSTINSSLAVQANATFHVTPRLRLVGGLRYTMDHKDRLGGFWMLGANLPQDGSQRCAEVNDDLECVELGLSSNDIGRFGTEGFRFRLLDRSNYEVPGPDASKEERVNFFFDSIESFGTRDQTAIALCNDPPPVSQISENSTQPPVQLVPERLRLVNGNLRCSFGIRDEVPESFALYRPQNGRANYQYSDFRAGIEYDLASNSLLYATVGSAHKAGGFTASIPSPGEPSRFLTPAYDPEIVYSVEVGSKNLLLEKKLRLNVAVFGYQYEKKQELNIIVVGEEAPASRNGGSILLDPETGQTSSLTRSAIAARENLPNGSNTYGLDVAATYALPFGLEANLHVLLMSARFAEQTYLNDRRLGIGSGPAQVDVADNWLPRASPFTINYQLSQFIRTPVGYFDWVVQAQTRGEHFMSPFNGDGTQFAKRGPGWGVSLLTGANNPIEADDLSTPDIDESTNGAYNEISQNLARLDDRVPTYTTLNFGVGWQQHDSRLSIRGFVNNVFNIAFSNTIVSNTNNIRSYNNPRMAGVRVIMAW